MFKGGTALKRCYFGDYRFSEDLDFTLSEEPTIEPILAGLEEVYDEVRRASEVAFRFARADRKQHQNSHTFYLAYEGPLPAASATDVKVDITIRERFVCALWERSILRGYDEYVDLPESSVIRVYAIKEITVEKVAALTDRNRNEPRDLYDIWYLTSEAHVDLAMLAQKVDRKLEFRGRTREGMSEELAKKEARYRKQFTTADSIHSPASTNQGSPQQPQKQPLQQPHSPYRGPNQCPNYSRLSTKRWFILLSPMVNQSNIAVAIVATI